MAVGDVQIVIDLQGPGWLTLQAVLPTEFQRQVEFDRTAPLLNRTLINWLKGHPSIRVRSTLGIVEDGVTTFLHVWFDTPPPTF